MLASPSLPPRVAGPKPPTFVEVHVTAATQPLRVNTELVAGEVVDGEAVIINLSNGLYYTMDAVGADVWQLIEGGASASHMAAALSTRYGVDPATVLADVTRVIAELVAEGLVLDRDTPPTAPTSAPPAVVLGPPAARYAAPALTRYTDMSEVLALDPPLPELGPNRAAKR